MGNRSFEVKPRPGTGWRLKLFDEDGTEVGGAVFDLDNELEDAITEGECWTASNGPQVAPRCELPAICTVESLESQMQETALLIDELIAACPPQAGVPYTPADVQRFDEAIARGSARLGFLCVAQVDLAMGTSDTSLPN
jgi:hypothetical protein